MSQSPYADILSASPNSAEATLAAGVEAGDELARLRAMVSSLHSALGVALFRLEEGGLAHHDLRAPLQEASRLFVEGSSDNADVEDIPVGPFIFGTLNQVPFLAGAVRFAFDLGTDRIAQLQIQTKRWENAEPAVIEEFRTWLLEENEDMIDHPENWELEKSDSPPNWVS